MRALPSRLVLLVVALGAMPFWLGQPARANTPPPPPVVTLVDVPPEALIGAPFKFKVKFTNPGPGAGFGPFLDVILPKGGMDYGSSGSPCDGITFVKAEMIDVNGGPLPLTAYVNPNPPFCNPVVPPPNACTAVQHPYAADGIPPLSIPDSAQLVTIQLPFGSFQPGQSDATVQVTAQVSPLADVGMPLTIYARGGYRFGNDALNNPSVDDPVPNLGSGSCTTNWSASKQVTPTVLTVTKEYLGPEDETATGPNFPRQYKITVDVAQGQHVTNLLVTDCLQSNMQYYGLVGTATTPGFTQVATPPPCLQLKYPSVTGVAGPDVTAVFKFYVVYGVGGVPVLDPDSCQNATSVDDVKAEGDWTPIDPRDLPGPQHVLSDVTPQDHVLTDKRLAIQKSVETYPVPNTPVLPGGILKYRLAVQVSDFFTMGGIVVDDVLADGQVLLTAPAALAPKLTVRDRRSLTATVVPFSSGSSLINVLDANAGPCVGVHGGRRLAFRVSTAMQNNPSLFTSPVLQQGILTGGFAFAPSSSIPATAEIVFYARVLDAFAFPHPPGDKFVDKDDPINNCVTVSGDIYRYKPSQPTVPVPHVPALRCSDDSKTALAIATDFMTKKVYAVTRGGSIVCGPSGPACSNSPSPPQDVRPGDQVTYRIEKTIPSSDAEHLTIEDFLPVPAFNVSDPDANGIPGPSWVFNNAPCTLPAPGQVCLGPSSSIQTLVPPPALLAAAATNSIKLSYVNFNDPANHPRTVDLLLTATVTNQPFADGLLLTNQSEECEKNTFGTTFCQSAIAQVNLREPNLAILKGAVATNNPNGLFNPPRIPVGVWKPFGTSCPRFNQPINSANLGGLINSNLSSVDASDQVTFGVSIENSGGSPAYDIDLADVIPLGPLDGPSCFEPDYSTLCVTDGSGTPIPFTYVSGPHGRTIIHLGSPLAAGSPFNAAGTNIAIVTFNAQLLDKDHLTAGCCDNVAQLQHYSSQPGGPDFVGAGYTPPFTDAATICVDPKAREKCIVQTSEPHTTPQNSASGAPQAAIGEVLRFRLIATVPEGLSPVYQIQDSLPLGLSYLGNPKAGFVSSTSGHIASSTLSGAGLNFAGSESTVSCVPPAPPLTFLLPASSVNAVAGSGGAATFSLGDLANSDNDTDLELAVLEFNALVDNVPGNVSGTTLTNSFSPIVNGHSYPNNLISVSAVVVEPHLTAQKTVAPNPALPGSTVSFSVSFTNTPGPFTSTAFDVSLTDPLPAGLSNLSVSSVTVSPLGCAAPSASVSSGTLTVNVPKMAVGCGVTVTFQALVAAGFPCPGRITNSALLRYTSLPGNGTPAGPNNQTGSITPGASGAVNGERVYTASPQAVLSVDCPQQCARPPFPIMVSWWPLNETNGNTVVDILSGLNGTTFPGSIGTLNSPASATAPKVVNALTFRNSGAKVLNDPRLNFGTANFSIDAWVRDDNAVAVEPIVDKLDTTGAVPTGFAFLVGSYHVMLFMGNGTATPAQFSSSSAIVPNLSAWHHVAVTVQRTGSGAPIGQFYLDGNPAGTFTPPANSVSNSADLLIGRFRLVSANCGCDVSLDEIEIFNDVVSASDILAIFQSGSIGKCTH